jgi:uncharacterized membrane protein
VLAEQAFECRPLAKPGKTDSWTVLHAGRSHYHYDELLRAGVRLHERRDSVPHAKTASIDGVWSTICSTNLDWWSFLHNDELNAVILGAADVERDTRTGSGAIRDFPFHQEPQSDRRLHMKTLIVGRYEQLAEAENASRDLLHAGFPAHETSLFYLNPQGQHALHPVGGDEDESAGTHEASSGAVRGAVGGIGAGTLVGLATLPVLGPAGPLLGAAVGAYAGSLVGALNNMDEPDAQADPVRDSNEAGADVQPRKAGVMLAVAIATPAERENAIEILGAHAQQVEEAEGMVQNGEWVDFDPLAPGNVIR